MCGVYSQYGFLLASYTNGTLSLDGGDLTGEFAVTLLTPDLVDAGLATQRTECRMPASDCP